MSLATMETKPKSVESGKAAAGPLSDEELRKMHAYWRAANYLSVHASCDEPRAMRNSGSGISLKGMKS